MSGLKKLEALLRSLENVKSESKALNEGGFLGLAKNVKGAGLSGGACACGGKKKSVKCAQCKYVKCRCAGGVLTAGGLTGGSANFDGTSGGAMCGAAKKRGRKSGGAISSFDGAGLTGGAIQDFDGSGLTGGAIQDFDGSGLTGGRKKGVTPPQLKGWLAHVKQVKAKHPSAPYKDVLKAAKASYRK